MALQKKHKYTLLGIGLLLIISGFTGYTLWQHHQTHSRKTEVNKSGQTIDLSPGTKADNKPSDDRKGSSSPSTTLNNGSTATTTTPIATFSVSIVSANVNNGNVHVGTLVSGTSTGTCTLSASQNGQNTITLETSTVQQDINAYDCGVFNIATSRFPSSGSWTIKLTVLSGQAQQSDSKVINIIN